MPSKNLSEKFQKFNEIYHSEPDYEVKAWDIIHKFYHYLNNYMDDNKIKRSDLAKKLNKSRASISQFFNKTPNISIMKMVELSNAVGLEFDIVPKNYNCAFNNFQYIKIYFSESPIGFFLDDFDKEPKITLKETFDGIHISSEDYNEVPSDGDKETQCQAAWYEANG